MKPSNLLNRSLAALMLLGGLAASAVAATTAPTPSLGSWKLLQASNERFASGKSRHPNVTAARRGELAGAQHPFAVIVSCSDSRVPPELLFDQGLGDLFVIRTAGHVVDSVGLGSIEYAVAKLGARTIVVLGHERCGAVQAALAGDPLPGSIGSIVERIEPAIGGPHPITPQSTDAAVKDQVRATVAQLQRGGAVLGPIMAAGELEVLGAVYDLDTGRVERVTTGEGR